MPKYDLDLLLKNEYVVHYSVNCIYEQGHEISNNVVFDQQRLRPACAYGHSDQSLC